MPRPKVRPEDRQRAVKACVPCKNSKKRCDSRAPCSNCCRRDLEAACTYDDEGYTRPRPSQTRRAMTSSSIDDMRRTAAPSVSIDGSIDMDSVMYHDAMHASRHAPQTPESTLAPCSDSTPDVPTSPRLPMAHGEIPGGRAMLNSKGEKVHMGDSASLSFLHFLRQTLLHYMGPSPFTDNKRANVMLEAVVPQTRSAELPEGSPGSELAYEEEKEYLERFFTATTGIIFLFSPEQMFKMLEERERSSSDNSQDSSSPSSQRDAIVDLAIAIGGQCCDTTPESLRHAHRHFERAQKVAFDGMLLDPSLDMICIFLLMSMYMLGACRRNGAFMYLGVAARSAHALGLHVPESYLHLEPDEHSLRSQVWKSLRILDIAIGSVLSRPPASSPKGPHPEFLMANCDERRNPSLPEFLSMSASFEACSILEQIMDHLDHKRDVNLASIEDFLTRLRQWSQSLPASVRFSSVSSPLTPEHRRQALGNFAVSCFYYFSVILITRPVLISYLLTRLKMSDPSAEPSSSPRALPPEAEQIAQVCVDAAILMAETARRAQTAGLLVQNMCLLKAWLFSASLVLGFSVFVEASCPSSSGTSFEAEGALHGSISVIKGLARTSPQAHHYLDVLTEFLAAIKKHRERLVPPRRRGSGQYLSQIFILDQEKSTPGESEMEISPVPTGHSGIPPEMGVDVGGDPSGAGLWMLQQAAEATQGMGELWKFPDTAPNFSGSGPGPVSMGAFDLDWGSISLQVTESSLFETDPFMSMLDQF